MALKAMMLDGVDPVEKAEREEKERLEKAARNTALSTTLRQVMNHYLEHKRTKHGPLRPASMEDIIRHVTVNMADWIDEPIGDNPRQGAGKIPEDHGARRLASGERLYGNCPRPV